MLLVRGVLLRGVLAVDLRVRASPFPAGQAPPSGRASSLGAVRSHGLKALGVATALATLHWAALPAIGNADRGDRSEVTVGQDTSHGRAGRVGRPGSLDQTASSRPRRAEGRFDGQPPAVDRTRPVPVPGEDGDSFAPGDGGKLDALAGLSEADATAAAAQKGFTVRIVARDGEWYPVTKDYRLDRINLVVAGGVVVGATIG